MSITAFPVLARILSERRLTGTYLGGNAIVCAAVDDVTAWSILAIVVAIASARGFQHTLATIGFSILFVFAMLRVIRPILGRVLAAVTFRGVPGKGAMAGILIFLLASALTTEAIGLHAPFGALLAGVVMPREPNLRRAPTERLGEANSILLLPLFFAFTGLRTEISLLSDRRSRLLCLVIIFVATVGKLGGSAARSASD
jgi:K+:H+ antiporter